MTVVRDIFFWIGALTIGEFVLVAVGFALGGILRRRAERGTCMAHGCSRRAMPGWKVCLRCRNKKTIRPLSEGLQFLRDARRPTH